MANAKLYFQLAYNHILKMGSKTERLNSGYVIARAYKSAYIVACCQENMFSYN